MINLSYSCVFILGMVAGALLLGLFSMLSISSKYSREEEKDSGKIEFIPPSRSQSLQEALDLMDKDIKEVLEHKSKKSIWFWDEKIKY